jgi:branched-subunit amino acid transport protein AzlD
MASSFAFTLKPEKENSQNRIALLVVLMHLITFIILAFTRYPKGIGMLGFGITVAVIYLLLFYIIKNRQFRTSAMEIPIYVFSLWWLFAQVYWMAALMLLFSIFASLAKQKVTVIFTVELITYQSFPKRTFKWADLNNVVLKDDMLTIDFKNNKIIQQLVEDSDADSTAFNQFCVRQLMPVHGS